MKIKIIKIIRAIQIIMITVILWTVFFCLGQGLRGLAQPPAPPGLSGAPVNPRQVVPHPPTNDSTATGTHTYDYTFYTVTNIELVTNVHLKKWAEFRDGSNIIRVPVSDKIVSSSKDGKNTWSVQIKQ